MLAVLRAVEQNLPALLLERGEWIGYRVPEEGIKRVVRRYRKEHYIFLQTYDPRDVEEATLHPHPWESAIHVFEGQGLTREGRSITVEPPSRLTLNAFTAGHVQEMIDPAFWHSTAPIDQVLSIMVTGERWSEKERPIPPELELQRLNFLNAREIGSIINRIRAHF